jgi:hypothetical protein
MCRNIKTLFNFNPPANNDEIHAAATQYVRKITGFQKPSAANEAAFNEAVGKVTEITSRLLGKLVTNAPSRNREAVEAKAHANAVKRFGNQD